MTTYTNELQAELERVTLRGSPDKKTIAKLASIIWRMDQRLQILEEEIVVDEKRATPYVTTPITTPSEVNEGPDDVAVNKPTTNEGPADVTAEAPAKQKVSVRGRGRPAKEK